MRSLRRLFIVVAQLLQLVSLVIWTAAGAWAGGRLARLAIDSEYVARNIPEDTILNAGIVGGAFVGFAIAATAAALVFAFAQIEINTREMARYYVERRRSEAAIQRAMNQAPVS